MMGLALSAFAGSVEEQIVFYSIGTGDNRGALGLGEFQANKASEETVEVDKNNPAKSAIMDSHRNIIDGKAAEGARYVGWFPVRQTSSGKTLEFDLIFEVE